METIQKALPTNVMSPGLVEKENRKLNEWQIPRSNYESGDVETSILVDKWASSLLLCSPMPFLVFHVRSQAEVA